MSELEFTINKDPDLYIKHANYDSTEIIEPKPGYECPTHGAHVHYLTFTGPLDGSLFATQSLNREWCAKCISKWLASGAIKPMTRIPA